MSTHPRIGETVEVVYIPIPSLKQYVGQQGRVVDALYIGIVSVQFADGAKLCFSCEQLSTTN